MEDTPYPGIPRATPPNTSNLPPYVEAVLFFLCGLLIGAGTTVYVMNNSIQTFLTRPDQIPDRILQRMDRSLDLTPSQHEAAKNIIERHFVHLDTIHRNIRPEVELTMDALRDDVARILNDQQREIWERRFREIREKWQPGPIVPTEVEVGRTRAH